MTTADYTPIRLNRERLARVWGITPEAIRLWVKAGHPPPSGTGHDYDLRESVAWFRQRAEAARTSRSVLAGPDIDLLIARTDRELEIAKAMRRDLLDATDMRRVIGRVQAAIEQTLDRLANDANLARDLALASTGSACQAIAFARCREARREAADALDALADEVEADVDEDRP